MNAQISAVRQDSQFINNDKFKFTKEVLNSQKIISKIYEIEFFENFGMIMTKIKIREKGRQSRKETLSIKKILKNQEYKAIFDKLLHAIGLKNTGPDTMFEKILETLSKPFVKDDSISDFTLIEYMNGERELAIQPEII